MPVLFLAGQLFPSKVMLQLKSIVPAIIDTQLLEAVACRDTLLVRKTDHKFALSVVFNSRTKSGWRRGVSFLYLKHQKERNELDADSQTELLNPVRWLHHECDFFLLQANAEDASERMVLSRKRGTVTESNRLQFCAGRMER